MICKAQSEAKATPQTLLYCFSNPPNILSSLVSLVNKLYKAHAPSLTAFKLLSINPGLHLLPCHRQLDLGR